MFQRPQRQLCQQRISPGVVQPRIAEVFAPVCPERLQPGTLPLRFGVSVVEILQLRQLFPFFLQLLLIPSTFGDLSLEEITLVASQTQRVASIIDTVQIVIAEREVFFVLAVFTVDDQALVISNVVRLT